MARGRPPKLRDPREDWIAFGPADDGSGIQWSNTRTGALATLPEGVHPLDAPTHDLPVQTGEDESEGLDVEESAVDRIRVTLRGTTTTRADVRVYRVRDDGTLGFCRTYTPDEFDAGGLDLLARQWGPGQFEIRLYGSRSGSNKYAVLAKERVAIEKPADTAATPLAESNALVEIIRRMDTRLAAIEQAPRPDPMAEMQRTVAMLASVRDLFAPPPAASPPTPAQTMKELAETMSVLRMVREEIEPAQPPDDPLAASLPKLLEIISGAQAAQRANPAEPLPTVSVPHLPSAPEPVQNPGNETENDDAAMIKLAFVWLVSEAKKGGDIEAAAETVYDRAPDELLSLLKTANYFEQLCAIYPPLAPWREWIDKVRDRVLEIEREENARPTDKAA
jgi:hypothetical protein